MSFTNYEFPEVMEHSSMGRKYTAQIYGNAASVTLSNSATSETAAEQITGEIRNCHGADYVNFNFTVDINQAQNVRILCYGLIAEGDTTKYLIPWSATQNYFECTTDADMSWFATWTVNKAFGTYVFYGFMGTDGGTNPAITSSYVSLAQSGG